VGSGSVLSIAKRQYGDQVQARRRDGQDGVEFALVMRVCGAPEEGG
jgi:hypothetical protein